MCFFICFIAPTYKINNGKITTISGLIFQTSIETSSASFGPKQLGNSILIYRYIIEKSN
jgi:hypothetical protein